MVCYPGCLEPRGFLRHETFRDKSRKVLGKLEYVDHSERETDDVYEKAERDLCNLRRNQLTKLREIKLCFLDQPCPILCEPMDCSPPGSSVLGILQARVLEWVAISFSRESSHSRDQTQVSCNAGRLMWATREALSDNNNSQSLFLCAV